MANRYWVGGSGTWSSTNTANWSSSSGGPGGASVPTAADYVYFDANSGSGTVSFSFEIVGNRSARDVEVQSGTPVTFSNNSTEHYAVAIAEGGSVLFTGKGFAVQFVGSASFSVGPSGTDVSVGYVGISAGKTVTLGGLGRFSAQNFTNNGTLNCGTSAFNSYNVNNNSSGTINLNTGRNGAISQAYNFFNYGTLNANSLGSGAQFSAYNFYQLASLGSISSSFASFPASTSALLSIQYFNADIGFVNFNNSTRNLSTYSWIAGSGLNLLNAGSMGIEAGHFEGGGKAYGTVFAFLFSYPQFISNPGGTISTLNLTRSTDEMVLIGSDLTVTTLVLQDSASPSQIRNIISNKPGTRRTISYSSVSNAVRVNFSDIGMSPPLSGTDLGDGGNCSGITFPASKTLYVVGLNGGASVSYDNWSYAYSSTSGGSPTTLYPLAHDTVIIDANSGTNGTFFAGGNGPIGSLTVSNANVSVKLGTTINCYGNLSISSSNNIQNNTNINLYGRANTSSTLSLPLVGGGLQGVSINILGGIYQLNSAIVLGTSYETIHLDRDATLWTNNYGIACSSIRFDNNYAFYGWNGYMIKSNQYALSLGTSEINLRGLSSTPLSMSQTVSGSVLSVSGSTYVFRVNDGSIVSNADSRYFTFALASGSTLNELRIEGSNVGSEFYITDGGDTLRPRKAFNKLSSTKTVNHGIRIQGTALNVADYTISGSPSHVVSLQGPINYTGSTPPVVTSYMNISNSTATPSQTWYAPNSTDGGGNSGWTFATPGGGNGLLFGSNF